MLFKFKLWYALNTSFVFYSLSGLFFSLAIYSGNPKIVFFFIMWGVVISCFYIIAVPLYNKSPKLVPVKCKGWANRQNYKLVPVITVRTALSIKPALHACIHEVLAIMKCISYNYSSTLAFQSNCSQHNPTSNPGCLIPMLFHLLLFPLLGCVPDGLREHLLLHRLHRNHATPPQGTQGRL